MSFSTQALASLAITAVYAALALGISVLSARLMPLAEYGLYASVLGYVLILSGLLSGMPGYLMREVTTAEHQNEPGVLTGLIRRSVRWILMASCAIAIIAGGIWLIAGGTPNWWAGFAIGIGVFAAFGLINALGAILRGLGQPIRSQLPGSIVRPVLQIAALATAASLLPLTGAIALAILLGASLVALLFAANLLRGAMANRPAAPPIYRDRVWLIGMATFGLATGFQRVNQHLGTVSLQQLGTIEQVALFQPAVEALLLMGLPTLAVMVILMPLFRRAFLDGDRAAQQTLIDRAHWLTFATTVLLTTFLALLGPSGIAAIFGPAFDAAYPAIAIIAVGQVAAAALGNPLAILNQADRERAAAAALACAVALNLLLLILFIPAHGIEGAALATSIAIFAGRLIMAIQCRRALGLRTWLWL